MKLKSIFILSLAALALLACKKEPKEDESKPVLEVSQTEISVGADAAAPTFTVTSNRTWKIQMVSQVPWIGIDPSSGGEKTKDAKSVEVTVSVAANDVATPRSCTFYVVSDDPSVEDYYTVTVNQEAGQAPVTVEFSATIPEKTSYADPAVFSSLGCSSRWFSVHSSAPWTARVAPETTASNVSLVTTSGEGDLEKFEVKVGPNTDKSNRKDIIIEFTPQGGEPYKVTLQQEKGSILTLEFRNQDGSAMVWPFTAEAATEAGDKGPGSFECGGYTFPYYTVADCMMESAYGWRLGTGKGCWIGTPVVEGLALTKITMVDRNSNVNPNIETASGDILPGGAFNDLVGTYTNNQPVYWNLTGTAPGQSYRIMATEARTIRALYLSFEYSEPSDYLSVASTSNLADVPYAGANGTIGILSNKAWTAKVKDGSTASVSLDPVSGSGNATISVKVGANSESVAKSAVIVLSAAGCPDIEVPVSQVKAPSALSVELSLPEKVLYSDPGLFPSIGTATDKETKDKNGNSVTVTGSGKRKVIVTSSKAWTARVGAATTASGVALSKTSGTGNDVIEVSVGPNTDFANRKKVVVEVAAEGEDYAKIELEQEKAAIITIESRNFDSTDAAWPFDETPNIIDTENSGTGTSTVAGYSFGWKATTTYMIEVGSSTAYGLRLGRGVGDYFAFPAIPGRKLVKVYVLDGNAGGDCHIRTSEGVDVAGGNLDAGGTASYYKNNAKKGVTFNLTGTEANTSYRLEAILNGTIRIRHLELTYE